MKGGEGADGSGGGGGSTAAVVVAVRRRRWQCSDGVPFARENSSGNQIIVPRIVPRIVPKPWRKILFFEKVLALFKVLFGGTIICTIK
jgi:hypothetical protein